MNKELLILSFFLVAAVQAYTISDYPSFFVQDGKFRAIYVIGEEAPSLDVVSATVVSTALAKYPNVTTEIGTSRIDSEISDIKKENAIVIGSPCENIAAAQLEGNPEPCYKNLSGSTGYLKLFESNGKVQLLITGLTAEDRHQTAKFLASKNLDAMKLKEYIVQTSTNSIPPTILKTVKNETKPANYKPANYSTNSTQQAKAAAKVETPKEVPLGDYEPLEELPLEKSVFVRFWNWLMRLF